MARRLFVIVNVERDSDMISRILAILVIVLSVAFLGFAFAATYGGPNWGATARSMKQYQFTQSAGENSQWTATSADGETVGTSPLLPGAIVAALDNEIKQLQARLSELNAAEPILVNNVSAIEQQVKADGEALNRSIEQKRLFLAQLQNQFAEISGQIVLQTEQGNTVEKTVSDRRSDVFRLSHQLGDLRADEARIEQIHRQMADLIEQIDGDLDIARRREQQLRLQLQGSYE